MRRPLDYIFLFVKGICVGATGVLQGISGASMALLLGIYHEFVFALAAFDATAWQMLAGRKFSDFWKRINGNFLTALTCGIITGLVAFRSLFRQLLDLHAIYISSFFFSLVIIAALLLLRKITRWNAGIILCIAAGFTISFFLTVTPPLNTGDHAAMTIVSGFLTGTTFVIPGVSGAFILIFLAKYQYILASFSSLEIAVIIPFIAGGILGIVLTTRLMALLLADYHNATVGLFAGLMIGSLNKIWPWREVFEYATTIQGRRIPAFDKSVLPWRYLELTGKDPQVFYAILMMALGVFMVVLIEKIAARLKTKS